MRILRCGKYYVNVNEERLIYSYQNSSYFSDLDVSGLVRDFQLFTQIGCDLDGDVVQLRTDERGAYFVKFPKIDNSLLYVDDTFISDHQKTPIIILPEKGEIDAIRYLPLVDNVKSFYEAFMNEGFSREEITEILKSFVSSGRMTTNYPGPFCAPK